MLREETLFGVEDKVQIAIERLQHFEPPEGYWLGFSGGKDSVVIKELADMAKVKYDAHYSVTCIDPPELVAFIKRYHPDVIWNHPEMHMLTMMVKKKKGFPLRRNRWCCGHYKENGGNDRRVVTGVRREESATRAHRPVFHHCFAGGYKSKNKTLLNPIIDWDGDDVWAFIKERRIPYCRLYDEGFERIGCIMCPLAKRRNRLMEAERYPGYVKMFRKAFRELYDMRKREGKSSIRHWNNGDEMFDWWLYGKTVTSDPMQGHLIFG